MSSSIYTTIPYFYIIRHKETGKQYAGSKWAKNSHPKKFMVEDGYKTSSRAIQKIIEKEGLQAFEIVELLTEEECGMSVYDYETKFLCENNIADNDNWFNYHNNDRNFVPYGSDEHKKIIQRKYSVDNISKSDEIKESKVKTCLANFGVQHPMQSSEIRRKSITTNRSNYGVDNASQREDVKQQKILTCLANFGVENPAKSESVKKKQIAKLKENYGVENPMYSPEVKAKLAHTRLIKKNRPIVGAIKEKLDILAMRPQDFGFTNVWMYQSDEKLAHFISLLSQ